MHSVRLNLTYCSFLVFILTLSELSAQDLPLHQYYQKHPEALQDAPEYWPEFVQIKVAFSRPTSEGKSKDFPANDWYKLKKVGKDYVKIEGICPGNVYPCSSRFPFEETNFVTLAVSTCYYRTGRARFVEQRVLSDEHTIIPAAHASPIVFAKLTMDESHLITIGDRFIKSWDLNNRGSSKILHQPEVPVHAVDTYQNQIAFATLNKASIYYLSNESLTEIRSLHGHYGPIASVRYSQDGKLIATVGDDGYVKVWDTQTGDLLFNLMHNEPMRRAEFLSSNELVTLAYYGKMFLWDLTEGKYNGETNFLRDVVSIHHRPGKDQLLSFRRKDQFYLFDTHPFELSKTFPGGDDIFSYNFSQDGQLLAVSDLSGKIWVWDVESGLLLSEFKEHNGRIYSLYFASDNRLISAGADRSVKSWRISDEQLVVSRVKKKIELWQKKGKYESSQEYQLRVNSITTAKKVEEITPEVISHLANKTFKYQITQTQYDPDNEVFRLHFVNGSSILLPVPISQAESFDSGTSSLSFASPNFGFDEEGRFFLVSAKIKNRNSSQVYKYDLGTETIFERTKIDIDQSFQNMDIALPSGSSQIDLDEKRLIVGKSDVDKNIPTTNYLNPDAVAVIIGNSIYNSGIPPANYAKNDAQTVSAYLQQAFGLQEANIQYRENATKGQLELLLGNKSDLGKLNDLIQPGKSDVFFYYSGHGLTDTNNNEPYLVPSDAELKSIGITGFSLSTLYENLSKIPARSITVILDASFSGRTRDGTYLIKQASPVGLKMKTPMIRSENSIVFLATSKNQNAWQYAEKKHGLFTYFFLKGLQGFADRNKDDEITITELSSYLLDTTSGVDYWSRSIYNESQSPKVFGREDAIFFKRDDNE